jgi:hypothetical protein
MVHRTAGTALSQPVGASSSSQFPNLIVAVELLQQFVQMRILRQDVRGALEEHLAENSEKLTGIFQGMGINCWGRSTDHAPAQSSLI